MKFLQCVVLTRCTNPNEVPTMYRPVYAEEILVSRSDFYYSSKLVSQAQPLIAELSNCLQAKKHNCDHGCLNSCSNANHTMNKSKTCNCKYSQ